MARGSAIFLITGCLAAVILCTSSQANQGWENAPESPSENGEALNPLHSVLAMVRFECAGRAGGYYGDMDFGCSVFHYCATEGQRFTFKCTDGLKFNEETVSCSAGFFGDCSHPEIIGSAGRNMTASPAPVKSFQNSPVFLKPEEDKSNDDPRDYPDGFIQHKDPALELDFEVYNADYNQDDYDNFSLEDSQTSSSINHVSRLPEKSIREATDLASKSVLSAFASLANLPLDNQVSGTARVDRYQRPVDRAFIARPPRRHQHHRNSILRPIPFVGGISKKKPGRIHPPQYNNAGINLIPLQPPHPYNTYREGDIQLTFNPRPEVQNNEYFVQTTTKPFRPSELITESKPELNAVTPESVSYTDQDIDNFIQPDAEAGDHIRPYRDANAQTGGTTSFQRFSSVISPIIPNGGFQLHTTPKPRAFQTTTKDFLNTPVFPPSGNFVFNQPPIHPSSPLFNKNTFLHTFPTGSLSQSVQPIQSTHPNTQHIHSPLQHIISPPTFSRFQPPRPAFHVTPPPLRKIPVSQNSFHSDHLNQQQFQDEKFTTHDQINQNRPNFVSSHEIIRPEVQSPHLRDNSAQTFNPNAAIQFNPHLNQQFEVKHQDSAFNEPNIQLHTNPFSQTHSDNSFINMHTGHQSGQSNEDHQFSQFAENPQHPPRHHPGQINEDHQFSQFTEHLQHLPRHQPGKNNKDHQFSQFSENPQHLPRHQPGQSNEGHQFLQFTENPLHPPRHENPHLSPDVNSALPQPPAQPLPLQEQDQFAFDKESIEAPASPQFKKKPEVSESSTTSIPHHRPITHQFTRLPHRRPINHQFTRQPLNPQLNGRHEPTSAPSLTTTQQSSIAPLAHDFIENKNDFSEVPKFVEDHRIPTTPHHHVTGLENSDVHGQFIQPNLKIQGHNLQKNNVPLLVEENIIQDETDNDKSVVPTATPHVTVLDFTGFRQSGEEFDNVQVMPHELSPIPVEFESPLLTELSTVKDDNIPHNFNDVHSELLEEKSNTIEPEISNTFSSTDIINESDISKTTSTRIPVFTRGSQSSSIDIINESNISKATSTKIPDFTRSSQSSSRTRTRPNTRKTTIAPSTTTGISVTKGRDSTMNDGISRATSRDRTTTAPTANSFRERLNRFRARKRSRLPTTTSTSTTTVTPVTKNDNIITPTPRTDTTRRILASDRFKTFRNRLRNRNNKSTTKSPNIGISTTATLQRSSDKENLRSNLQNSQFNGIQMNSEENVLQVKEIIKKQEREQDNLVKSEEFTKNESFGDQQENESDQHPEIENEPVSRPMDNPDVRARFREFLKNRRNRLSARFRSTVAPNVASDDTTTPNTATENIKNIVTDVSETKTELPFDTSTMIVKERMNIPHHRPLGGRRRVLVARKLIQDKNGETRIARRIIPGGRPLRNRVIPTIGSKNIEEKFTLDNKEIIDIEFKKESKVELDSSVSSTSEKTVLDTFSLSPSTLSAEFVPRPFHLPAQAIQEKTEIVPETETVHEKSEIISEIEIITAPPETFSIQVSADLSGRKNPTSSLDKDEMQKGLHDSKPSESSGTLDAFSTPDVLESKEKGIEATISPPLAPTIESPKELFENVHFLPFERNTSPIIEYSTQAPLIEFSTTSQSVLTTSENSKTTLAKMEKFQFKRPSSSKKESQSSTTQPPFIFLSQTPSPSEGKTTLADLLSGSKPRFQRPSKASVTTTEQSELIDIKPLNSMFIIPSSSDMKKDKSEKNTDSNHNKPSFARPDHRHSRPSFSFDIISKKKKNDSPLPISALDISEENDYKREENVTPMSFLTITMATDPPLLPLEMLWEFKR